MSADNGIYIHKFRKGWKVCHAQAIENVFLGSSGGYNYKILKEYFKDSPLFKTEKKALVEATRIYKEIMNSNFPIIEYGISFI